MWRWGSGGGHVTLVRHTMDQIVPKGEIVRMKATGMQFLEGPVWMKEGFLVFSDVRASEMKKYDPESGEITLY